MDWWSRSTLRRKHGAGGRSLPTGLEGLARRSGSVLGSSLHSVVGDRRVLIHTHNKMEKCCRSS